MELSWFYIFNIFLIFLTCRYEKILDEVNIRIQRELAEREIREDEIQHQQKSKSNGSSSGWFSGWFSSSKENSTEIQSSDQSKVLKRLAVEMSTEEKEKLFEVIDYQENAHHGIYPKSFVANQMKFRLDSLKITVRDEDLKDAQIMQMVLYSVECQIKQRPSADNVALNMTMNSLTITGISNKKLNFDRGLPIIGKNY